jgi:hypothetical protein
MSNEPLNENPRSLQQPWWLGKAQRHHMLMKFIQMCFGTATRSTLRAYTT